MKLFNLINDIVEESDLIRNNIENWWIIEEVDILGNRILPFDSSLLKVVYLSGEIEVYKGEKNIIDFLSELELSSYDEILYELKQK